MPNARTAALIISRSRRTPHILLALAAVLAALLLLGQQQAQALDSIDDFSLHSDNSASNGVWSDGTTLWAVNNTVPDSGDKIFAYTLADGSYVSSEDFGTLNAADNNNPIGIWSDGTTMWVADRTDDKLYAYKMFDKSYDSGRDIDVGADSLLPVGAWGQGNTLNSDNYFAGRDHCVCRSVRMIIWYSGGARLITDQQVVLLRQKLMEGKTQQAAAASAAMSERSARKWQRGSLPSGRRKDGRNWRTRADPFADVWESDVVPLLRSDPDGELSATTILEWLDERHPGRLGRSQLRTLQRRVRDHRALHGPDKEVYFQQEHPPGREAQVDFTHCTELGVTIGGEPFRHLLFHLVLSYSGWNYAEVCFGETFAALVKGLQGALWVLGGVPGVVRTDNLSAATHDLKNSRGRAMNSRYEAVLAHYGLKASRTNPRSSHENGVVEQGHRRLKNALDQALIIRGSRDFDTEDEYREFVREVVDRRNRLVGSRLKRELGHLRQLPPDPVPE